MAEELEKQESAAETSQPMQSKSEDADIVLDETSSAEEADKQVDFQKMTPAQKKKHIHEMKERKAKEKKAKEKADKEAAKAAAKAAKHNKSGQETGAEPGESAPKNSKLRIVVIALVIVVIVAGAVAYLYKKKHSHAVESKDKVVVVAPSSDTIATEAAAETVAAETPATPKEKTVAAKQAKASPAAKTSKQKQATKQASATPAKAGELQRPCWLISYISVATEKHAQKGVEELTAKGIASGYYWIPDYLPNGNKFYKVYAGPFGSKAEANGKLATIQELNQQAYVLLLK